MSGGLESVRPNPVCEAALPPVAVARPSTRAPKSHGLAEKTVRLREVASQPAPELLVTFDSSATGLSELAAERRLEEFGPNEVVHERPPAWYVQLASAFNNPFNWVLACLIATELWSSPDDLKGPVIIGVMIAISVSIRFVQEFRSGQAAERLKALVRTTATVLRRPEGVDAILSRGGNLTRQREWRREAA